MTTARTASLSGRQQAELFRHVSAEKAALYRAVMEAFAAAKRQFRLHLRPDELLAEGRWEALPTPPRLEELQAALSQLTEWGNLESQPDTTRVASIADFYRAKFLYRLSQGGEAVEAALQTFAQTLSRRAELQTVALEDIAQLLETLQALAAQDAPDAAKVHATLRDLVRVFEGLADNAQAFMAGIARSLELQQADAESVLAYKRRLIDYLERFIGDLVGRSGGIARRILALAPRIETLLGLAVQREARDAAPGDEAGQREAQTRSLLDWRERWRGLRHWFVADRHEPPQAELLRAKARAAIPQLLAAVAALNERRSGRSDRSADFRQLAHWFTACADDGEAHRLARAAFALNSARHLALNPAVQADAPDLPASTPWAEAPALRIHPRLREYGEAAPRGALPRVQPRDEERRLLAAQLHEEQRQIEAARQRLASAQPVRLSQLCEPEGLDPHAFGLFLALLGEALAAQANPDATVERLSGDGLLRIRLEPLAPDSHAEIRTPAGVLAGRDHLLTITAVDDAA